MTVHGGSLAANSQFSAPVPTNIFLDSIWPHPLKIVDRTARQSSTTISNGESPCQATHRRENWELHFHFSPRRVPKDTVRAKSQRERDVSRGCFHAFEFLLFDITSHHLHLDTRRQAANGLFPCHLSIFQWHENDVCFCFAASLFRELLNYIYYIIYSSLSQWVPHYKGAVEFFERQYARWN